MICCVLVGFVAGSQVSAHNAAELILGAAAVLGTVGHQKCHSSPPEAALRHSFFRKTFDTRLPAAAALHCDMQKRRLYRPASFCKTCCTCRPIQHNCTEQMLSKQAARGLCHLHCLLIFEDDNCTDSAAASCKQLEVTMTCNRHIIDRGSKSAHDISDDHAPLIAEVQSVGQVLCGGHKHAHVWVVLQASTSSVHLSDLRLRQTILSLVCAAASTSDQLMNISI